MVSLLEKHFKDTFGDKLPSCPDRDYGLKFQDVDACSSSDSELEDVLEISDCETVPASGPSS